MVVTGTRLETLNCTNCVKLMSLLFLSVFRSWPILGWTLKEKVKFITYYTKFALIGDRSDPSGGHLNYAKLMTTRRSKCILHSVPKFHAVSMLISHLFGLCPSKLG